LPGPGVFATLLDSAEWLALGHVCAIRFKDRAMSMDKSLKKGGGLARARNVLTRSERLAVLQIEERWTPKQGVFNIPKTKYRILPQGYTGPKRPGEAE
jgi:small basic protein (TIGR04137 family)